MKQILIDRTELLGKIIAIESGCLDMESRSVIHQIKETILRLLIEAMLEDGIHIRGVYERSDAKESDSRYRKVSRSLS